MKFLIGYLAFLNLASFLLMLNDKQRAKKKKYRVSELTFFMMSFLGGSLGVLFGIYLFRHKTKHLMFTLGIPSMLLVNLLMVFLIYPLL